EAFLVHKVVPVGVRVEERGGHHLEIGFLELLASLEGLVEDGLREQVAHLYTDERLPAARRRLRDLDVEAVVRSAFEFEERLPLDIDRFNQAGHPDILLELPV